MTLPDFRGSREECATFIRQRGGCYVYVLRRPDGRPFYVGKGTGDRVFHHENEARHPNERHSNSYKLNVIRAIWKSGEAVQYEISRSGICDEDALAEESALIAKYRRLHEGGPLTNLAAGGGSVAGPAPSSKSKHSATLAGLPQDNPERAILNAHVLSIAPMASVAIKPLAQLRARPTQKYPGKKAAIKPTIRQAVPLIASAAAHCIRLDGTATIPRKLTVQGIEALVENGVSCDILTSGLAIVRPAADPRDEVFELSHEQSETVVGLVGRRKASDLGVI